MKKYAKQIAISLFVLVLILPSLIWGIMGALNVPGFKASTEELGENRALAQIDDDVTLGNLTEKLEAYYNDRVPFRSKIILKYRKTNSKLEYIYQNRIQPVLVSVLNEKASMDNIEVSTDKDFDSILGDENEDSSVDIDEDADRPSEEEAEELEAKGIHEYKVIDVIKADYLTYGYTLKRCQNCGKFLKTDFSEKLIDDSYLPPKEGEGRVIQGRFNWLYYAGDNSIAYYSGTNILSDEEMKEWAGLMQ
ncbi:MAG: hypothetical protein Q4D29_07525, partial [Lachnospiraceae bacterium]|nr:hypothetical protein [Lachnospiraceae bacterium]